MGTGSSLPQDVNIVIIGAGYGGCELGTRLLQSKARFTIIDVRDAFHHDVATPRALAIPGYAVKTLIPLETTFGSHFKRGLVQSVDSKNKLVKLESGEEISYDILVIATGTKGKFPCKFGNESTSEALQKYNDYAEKVKLSSSIVVVGGGAVGVEVAAEISTQYPDKQVTIIHSHDTLVFGNESSTKFQNRLKEILNKQLKVRIIFGEKVANLDEVLVTGAGSVQTVSGTSIDADLVIPCTGLKVDATAYKDSLVGALDERGALRVDAYLQVEGEEDVYAIGDCSATGDKWLAYKAGDQANYLFKNLCRKFNNQAMAPYVRVDSRYGGKIVVGLGKNNTIGQLDSGSMIPELICRRVKADMFVGKMWGMMKQTPPK